MKELDPIPAIWLGYPTHIQGYEASPVCRYFQKGSRNMGLF